MFEGGKKGKINFAHISRAFPDYNVTHAERHIDANARDKAASFAPEIRVEKCTFVFLNVNDR